MFGRCDEILTAEDIMEILFISKNTAYKLLNSAKIKSFKIGRVHRIHREALEEYIQNECANK